MKRFLAILCLCATGCAAYKRQVWTPDSVSYTLQRDRISGDISDYWGATWQLK